MAFYTLTSCDGTEFHLLDFGARRKDAYEEAILFYSYYERLMSSPTLMENLEFRFPQFGCHEIDGVERIGRQSCKFLRLQFGVLAG